MMLGITECDEETAYFLKNGEWKKPNYKKSFYIPTGDDEHGRELYREFQQANFDEYFDWAKTYRFTLWR